MKPIILFRNDDVRGSLDKSLGDITNLFIEYNIPITHTVEPKNVTKEVIAWLLRKKEAYPDLIEITQHGFDHSVKSGLRKGEFGGRRNYKEQFDEIYEGRLLMDKYFGDNWFEAFSFPYGIYNPNTIKAVENSGFKVLNSHYKNTVSKKIFYNIGHLLKKGYWLNKHVSWHLDFYPGTSLFEIDVNISFIKKYLDENINSEMYSLNELKDLTNSYLNNTTVGILFHHRYHHSKEKLLLIRKYLDWLKGKEVEYLSSKEIFLRYSGNEFLGV